MNKSAILWILATMFFAYGCGVSEDTYSGGSGSGSGDTTAPTLLAKAPCDCGANVVTDATVSALFSEAMEPSSINDSTFIVNNGFKNISGTIIYSGTVATFKPVSNLSSTTVYTVTIRGVKDSAGNSMSGSQQWEFHTGSSASTPGSRFTDIQGIFDSRCTNCHTSGGASSFLPLTKDVSYQNLVGKFSNYTTGSLVRQGKSLESVLYQRISGATVGAQMPKDLPGLSDTDKTSIKTWIDEGALYN